MTNYKARFASALLYTEKLGFVTGGSPLPWSEKMSVKDARDILYLSRDILLSLGMKTSSDLAMKCVSVHTELQRIIYNILNVKTYITIGDKFWCDYVYCEMPHIAIEKELTNPVLGEPLKAHIWLTLPDGSILDCTAEAHSDIIFKRGEHPLEECLTFIPPDKEIKDGFHRPFLVGPEFLIRAGVFTDPNV